MFRAPTLRLFFAGIAIATGIAVSASVQAASTNGSSGTYELPSDARVKDAVIWREAAENMKDVLDSFAQELRENELVSAGDANAVRVFWIFYELSLSVQKDINAATTPEVVPLSNHTLEGIGRAGLALIQWRWETDSEGLSKTLGMHINRLDGWADCAAALFTLIGKGEWDPETVQQMSKGLHQVARQDFLDRADKVRSAQLGIPKLEQTLARNIEHRASLEARLPKHTAAGQQSLRGQIRKLESQISNQRLRLAERKAAVSAVRGKLEARLMIFDVFPELDHAVEMRRQQGRFTVDVIDAYSNVAIVLAASCIAMHLPGPDLFRVTIRDTIVAGTRFIKSASQPLFDHAAGVTRFKMLEEYARYQLQQVKNKQWIVPIDEYFTLQQRRGAGLDDRRAADANEQTNLLNTRTVEYWRKNSGSTAVQAPKPTSEGAADSSGGIKGVTVNPDPIFEPLDSR